jgi:hypothetical protein
MTNLKTISATEARNKWFEILNLVYFNGESIIIKKNRLPIIKLNRVSKPVLISTEEVIARTFGFLKEAGLTEWPEESREARRRKSNYLNKLWIQ